MPDLLPTPSTPRYYLRNNKDYLRVVDDLLTTIWNRSAFDHGVSIKKMSAETIDILTDEDRSFQTTEEDWNKAVAEIKKTFKL